MGQTINETARNDPDECRMEQLYRNPNGDTWFLARNRTTGLTFVRHQANSPSGGRVADIAIGASWMGHHIPNRQLYSASLEPRSSIRTAARLRTKRRPRTRKGSGSMQS
jgi:hypothetical protein